MLWPCPVYVTSNTLIEIHSYVKITLLRYNHALNECLRCYTCRGRSVVSTLVMIAKRNFYTCSRVIR